MSVTITKDNKKTMIANIVITVAICAIGIAIVEYSGLDSRVYIAVGMLAGAINVKIK